MSDYHNILTVAMLRILPACAILFGIVPVLLFPPFPSKSRMERMFGMALIMGVLTIVVMHLLVLLKINDNVAIVIICLWTIAFKWWIMYRRRHIGFVLIKSVLLRWIEIFSRPTIVKRFGITLSSFFRKEILIRLAAIAAFLAICAAAIYMRIGPIWNHPAPLSPEYYETLELVKRLQINQMYPGHSLIPIGMPIIISALCTAAQVNPTIAVHYFGIVSSLLLCASLYFSIYTAIRSRFEAALGTIVIACAYALLPFTVNHQIEADSLTLALVFLLPSLSFLMIYTEQNNRMHLAASLAGLTACSLINLFAGCVGLFCAAVILLSSFFILPALRHLRGRVLALHAALTVLVSAIAGMMWWYARTNEQVQLLLRIVFYDSHFYRYAQTDTAPSGPFQLFCAGMFVALIVAAAIPQKRRTWSIHLIGWGFTGIFILTLLPPLSAGIPDMIPAAEAVFILCALTAVSLGLCIGIVFGALQWLAGTMHASPKFASGLRTITSAAVLCAVIAIGIGRPASIVTTAEPDGFVKNLYVIERTFIPYQWTIVAHRGILLAGMNRGRFLDYDYFTARYDPISYRHGKPGAIPTALVFIFIEKNGTTSEITSELASLNKDAMRLAREWCETYMKTHSDMTVYYNDEKIIIYQLRDPNVPSLRV